MIRRTLRRPVALSGVGLHTGRPAQMRCVPAGEARGIVFTRADRPDAAPLPATVEAVSDATRAITLGGGGARGHRRASPRRRGRSRRDRP